MPSDTTALHPRIVCVFPEHNKEAMRWAQDLQTALPAATVQLWQPAASGAEPAADPAAEPTAEPTADYAVVWRPPQQFFDTQPALKAVFNTGAGVDALAGLRLPPQTLVVRLEDAGMAEQMTDYVVHAALHHVCRFDVYAAQQAQGEWKGRRPPDKAAYPVGILGYGVLGQAVAQGLQAHGFRVQAWARTARASQGQADAVRVYAGDAERAAFLQASRVLVCLLPLTPQTAGILCRDTFAQLQSGAYVINVARGAHLVVADLLQALDDGQLAGATLDVTEPEPLPADSPLWRHPAVRITPHIAAATLRSRAIEQFVAKIAALQLGQAISGVVQTARGY